MRYFILFIILFPIIGITQPGKRLSFSFSLPKAATVSAGVYKGDVLLRTIFNNKQYKAGSHTESFAALDDEMKPITSAQGLSVKVLSNNVKYEWEGVIGNASDSMTGNTVHHNYGTIKSLAFAGKYGYYAVGYNERKPSFGKFEVAKPNQRLYVSKKHIQADFVAADDKIVYWACSDPYSKENNLIIATNVSDDSEVEFKAGASYTSQKISSTFKSGIGNAKKEGAKITGLAVQKKGKYLFVAKKDADRVDVYDKTKGDIIFTIKLPSPGSMNVDAADNLWVISNGTIQQISVGANGDYKVARALSALSNAAGFAISPDSKTLIAIDDATSQLKAFDMQHGKMLWVFGQAGGYATNGPDVTTDKFYFKDLQSNFQTFVAYQPDGTFWVSDPGNTRVLHYRADRSYINSIAYRPISYSTFIDLNNPSRVFSDYSEYKVDFSKKLSPANGSWSLVKNWGAVIPPELVDKQGRLRNVVTLKNGRTYALISYNNQNAIQVVELPAKGNARMAGTLKGDKYDLYSDGSLRKMPENNNGTIVWKKRELLSFTSNGDPHWSEEKIIAKSPPVTGRDPQPRNIRSAAEITSGGLLIAYEGATPRNGVKKGQPASDRGNGFHLGAIKIGDDGKWLWRAAHATTLDYAGNYPSDGSFDIGNGVVRTGDVKHHAIDRYIFWGQHGEFWKGSQVNKWHHFYDNGLMLGQFGVTGPEVANEQAPYGMAGNAFTGNVVKINGDLFLTHNDEGHHSGVHVWKISNLSSIKEQVQPVTLSERKEDNNRVYLMRELPYNELLKNGAGGWKRMPETDDHTDKLNSYWEVKTNRKTFDRFADPDVAIQFRQKGKSAATLTKSLGNNQLNSWSLSGEINYEGNYASIDVKRRDKDGTGGHFLEVSDGSGKVIFRFFPQLDYTTKQMQLIANGTIVKLALQSELEGVTDQFQPFTLRVNNGKMMFKYASYPEITIDPMDADANYKSPATVQLFFWTNGRNSSRVISIKDFVFTKGTP